MNVQASLIKNNDYEFKNIGVKHTVSSFCGHTQTERILRYGQLIHQTSFDRDTLTKAYVCKHIRNNLGHKEQIYIVSAGCSTGEEALTYSMRLSDMKDKVHILGIDAGKDAIRQAKSGKFIFEIPKVKKDSSAMLFGNLMTIRQINAVYGDSYLVTGKNMSESQAEFKELFDKYFEPTGEKIKTPIIERINNVIMNLYGINNVELTRKSYKLKDGMCNNCQFIEGDVRDIDKILNGEKADVISFCNVLYHLILKKNEFKLPELKKNAENIIENLMTKYKNCLNEDGLIVFGEKEGQKQLLNERIVPKVMKRLNFSPIYSPSGEVSVWKKGKDLNT